MRRWHNHVEMGGISGADGEVLPVIGIPTSETLHREESIKDAGVGER